MHPRYNFCYQYLNLVKSHLAVLFLQAKCITEAEEKYEKLLKSLDPELSSNYQKRCEEATREGKVQLKSNLFYVMIHVFFWSIAEFGWIDMWLHNHLMLFSFRWEDIGSFSWDMEYPNNNWRRGIISIQIFKC